MVLVLHPRHKLEYFTKHKWEGAWIQAARDIVQDEFTRSYESVKGADDNGNVDRDSNNVSIDSSSHSLC